MLSFENNRPMHDKKFLIWQHSVLGQLQSLMLICGKILFHSPLW